MKANGTAAISIVLIAVLGVASVSHAGKTPPPPPPPYNPQITYSANASGRHAASLYVSNADGTDIVSLYSPSGTLGYFKFAPTGNRIVFVENNKNINVLTYAVSSQGVTTTSVTTLTSEPYQVWQVDVSPDGTQLLFVENTATPDQEAIYTMSMSGGVATKTLIYLPPGLTFDAVWAHSNSRIAVLQSGPVQGCCQQTIQIFDLDPTNNYSILNRTTVFTTPVSQNYMLHLMASAHTSDTLAFAELSGSTDEVYTVDFGTFAVSGPIVAGNEPSFSADDSTILFLGPPNGYLYEFNVNTRKQTLINSPKIIHLPEFLP